MTHLPASSLKHGGFVCLLEVLYGVEVLDNALGTTQSQGHTIVAVRRRPGCTILPRVRCTTYCLLVNAAPWICILVLSLGLSSSLGS